MRKSITTLTLLAIVGLTACGSDVGTVAAPSNASAQTSAPTAQANVAAAENRASSAPLSLFSETLHDLPMPEPGHARVALYGEVHEVPLLANCSTSTEPPPADQERAQHRFQSHFTIELGDRNVNIDVIRVIYLDEERQWRQKGHEREIVGLRNIARYGGETFDQRSYSLRRNRPEDTPEISRTLMERPGPPQAGEEVPAIRVHPDGRRVTYMGRLRQQRPDPSSDYHAYEALNIAIHCGPV